MPTRKKNRHPDQVRATGGTNKFPISVFAKQHHPKDLFAKHHRNISTSRLHEQKKGGRCLRATPALLYNVRLFRRDNERQNTCVGAAVCT